MSSHSVTYRNITTQPKKKKRKEKDIRKDDKWNKKVKKQ